MARQDNWFVKTYQGSLESATRAFEKDAIKHAARGYFPTSQAYTPGAYGAGAFILALLLCFVFVGFLIFLYMLIVKPAGSLTVTYKLQESASAKPAALPSSDEKVCPQCAEHVKAAAKICRFCGHTFATA